MEVTMTKWPTDADWMEVKKRALVTIGKSPITPPDLKWKENMLMARHSPIRALMFSFTITCPSWVATHYCRHVHAQPYVRSQRNDRQDEYDRNAARQDAPVTMILDVNAEELMNIMNKRLCQQASAETREVATLMRLCVLKECPEFLHALVPMCMYHGGICHEMRPCGKFKGIKYWRNWIQKGD